MRAAIEAVATCAEAALGSRALAVAAARRALATAGRHPDGVEIVINAGMYRDQNIIEPAMAPFVQRGIGANSSYPPLNGTRTFSFDLSNGACGFLTAIRVVDGFMRSGVVRSGLVVASDAEPYPSRPEARPLAASGGAVLLHATAGDEGFAWFHARTWSEHFPLYDAGLYGTYQAAVAAAAPPRIQVRVEADFVERCLDCACAAVDEVSRRGDLDLDTLDLLLTAHSDPGFAEALGERLGLAGRVLPSSPPSGAHTAATAFALEAAMRDGSWQPARRILFLAAGAGVTVSLALYEK